MNKKRVTKNDIEKAIDKACDGRAYSLINKGNKRITVKEFKSNLKKDIVNEIKKLD